MKYRLIHYVPDHLRGDRVPVAAAVSLGNTVEIVRVEHLPGPQCLGSERRATMASMVQHFVDSMTSFEALPDVVGHHALLDVVRDVPAGLKESEAVEWVRSAILGVHEPRARATRRGPGLARYGRGFFKTWEVARHVKNRFKPASDLDGWLSRASGTLEPVTHWVAGRSSVLFMEPILPGRRSFEADLMHVGTRLRAYRHEVDTSVRSGERKAKLIAYVLRGGDENERAKAIDSLRDPCDEVIDTSNTFEAASLASEIRAVALSADGQGRFETP